MQQFAEPVTDKQGNALVGAQVTVYTTDGYLATLYAADEVTVIGNPVTTDERGMCVFKAQNGNYRRTVTFSGVTYDVKGDICLDTPVQLAQTKYLDGAPALLFPARTSGSGSRNVIQGHAIDFVNKQWYALQLNDSSNTFFIRKLKFGNPRIPTNVTDITPASPLVVHQGLFYTDAGSTRYIWVGGDAGSPVQVVRVTESTGAVTLFPFNPNLTPGATGTWSGNVTCNLNLAGTKLFVRLGNGIGDFILRYDWAAFQANSATLAAEALFPVAVEQYAGTSFQGIAADEDTIYAMSGNTTQTLNKLLYAYDFNGNIRWKRQMAPHYFDSFFNGTKCEVEGISIATIPTTGQRILTLMVEMGTSGHNVHRMYGIPQSPKDMPFGSASPGLFFNDYDAIGIGSVPPSDGDVMFQVVDPTPLVGGLAQTTRFGVRNMACVGPTGGGVQMNVGTDGAAYITQREAMPLYVYTNNQQRAVFAADKTQATFGAGETGPYAGGIHPGAPVVIETGLASTGDVTAADQSEAFKLVGNEGSQDIGADEGIRIGMYLKLTGSVAARVMGLGFKKVTSSDSTTNSDVFIDVSPGTGQAPVKYFNFTSSGIFAPLADATQSIGSVLKRWATGFFAKMYLGAGATFETSGTGSPEGVITAPVGSRYWREDGGSNGIPLLYKKATGTLATGWAPGNDLVTVKQTAVASAPLTGTLVETVLATITIPGGLMGPNGVLTVVPMPSMTNSANNKTLKIKFGGVVYSTPVFSTSVSAVHVGAVIRNRGATNSQIGPPPSATTLNGTGASSLAFATSTLDTTVDQIVTITGQLANTADSMTLEGYTVQVNPGY